MKALSLEFFNGPAPLVAEELIGCYLIRLRDGKKERYLITETEAYDGFKDRASHAFRGKTSRNSVMFGPGGYLYIYFVYGIHWMLNIVTGPKDHPSAVLIRGVEGMKGPAILTKRLGIAGEMTHKKLGRASGIWIEGREEGRYFKIKKTPRIGVDYAGPLWSKKKWRFVLQ